MNKIKLTLFAFLILILLFIIFYFRTSISGNVISDNAPIKLTNENLVSYLETQSIIKDMPSSGIVLLEVNDGKKIETYVIKKSNVKKGFSENPDAVVNINLGQGEVNNFCNEIRNLIKNNNLTYELRKSKTSLMWKYKWMLKYTNCFS